MALSQDQAKIIVQILSSLRYKPQDGKDIADILVELDKFIIDKTIDIPLVLVNPENINITIERKAK